MQPKIIDTFYPPNKKAWRQWLQKNHKTKQAVWLMLYKKESGKPTISWSDAVDEALCFGWIDSIKKSVDEEHFIQFFSKRKPTGTWSKINKEKIEQLTAKGLMAEAGLAAVQLAQTNGTWALLDAVEALQIPHDLLKAFKTQPGSKAYFTSLSKSVKKAMLQWLVLAKQPATRQKRIEEIAVSAAQKQKPKQF